MQYREYLDYRQDVIAKSSELIDAGDLDLYGKFPRVAKDIFENPDEGGHKGNNVHRCHLVEDFLRVYGLDGEGENTIDKKLVSYSKGVRQSLILLMDLYKDRKWLIPSDNYPYYQNLANTMKVSYEEFDTLGYSGLENVSEASGDEDILLATYPLKPSGVEYVSKDWDTLRSWLAVNDSRRVILDAVYLFDLEGENELFKLFHETRQVIILYSLSKAFAAPYISGFTFTYDQGIRDVFKDLPREVKLEEGMRLGYLLLNRPEGLNRRIEIRTLLQNCKASAIAKGILPETFVNEGYLFYLAGKDYKDLVSKGILTVPSSVYESKADGVVISTLSV